MKRKSILILIPILLYSFQLFHAKQILNSDLSFEIEWVDKMEGDFTFTNKWSYPEGVYLNQFGQLSCDGFCPIEIDDMKDDQGKILKDSLEAFYEIIDTTHLFHSLISETSNFAFGKARFINVIENSDGRTRINSETNFSTHSSLKIEIEKSKFSAKIDFASIRTNGIYSFKMNKGSFKIDKSYWEKGILKATFDLSFENTLNLNKKIIWRGKMFKEIEKEKKTNQDHTKKRY